MEWKRENIDGWCVYNTYKNFNGVEYKLSITVYDFQKSIKYFVSLSSGKKRKDLDVYEDKPFVSGNGLSPLLWAKDTMFTFPSYWKRNRCSEKRKEYILVKAEDSRRRRIYERLRKYGFIKELHFGEIMFAKRV